MFAEEATYIIAIFHYVGDMGNFILSPKPVANTDGTVFEIVPLIHENSAYSPLCKHARNSAGVNNAHCKHYHTSSEVPKNGTGPLGHGAINK